MGNFERLADGSIRPWLPRHLHMLILGELWAHTPTAVFPTVEVPVLLIPAGDGTAADLAAQLLPTARVRAFPGADHDVHAQYPVEVAAAIQDAIGDGFFAVTERTT